MNPVTFDTLALPVPQGSLRSYRLKDGRSVIKATNQHPLVLWRGEVRGACMRVLPEGSGLPTFPSGTPVLVSLTFRFPRPRSHYGKRGLLPSAPPAVSRKPDIDKLVRSVLDALTGLLWHDDSQVVGVMATKVWADHKPVGLSATVEVADGVDDL